MASPVRVSVVIGVDGSGRTHRLDELAATGGRAIRIDPPLSTLEPFDGALVLIDDAHRLSAAQLGTLAEAARRGTPMVLARRPTIDTRELAELDEAVSRQGTVEQLGPLTPAEVAALVARLAGVALSADTATTLQAMTAGWPALIAAAGPGMTAGPALIARVQRRLAQLDEPVAALGRLLALQVELADGVLAAAAGLDESAMAGAMRTLRDEGLLRPGVEVMVPLVAEAVLAELPATQRRRVHDELARALIAAGGDPQVTAAQLRAARVHTPAAGSVYLAVAEQLRFQDAAAAAGWYDDAADAGADPPLVAAGRAETAAQLGQAVDHDAGASAAAPSTPAGQRVALVDAAIQAHEGRTDRSADALLAAPPPGPVLAAPGLAATGRLDDAVVAAAAAGPAAVKLLAQAAIVAARDPAAAVPLLIEAAELAERSVPPVVLPDTPHALGALAAAISGDVATAEHLLQRALDAGTGGPAAQDRHRLLLAFVRLRAGRYDTAVAELARLTGAVLRGRERLLYAALAAGVARRSGDLGKLRDAWTDVEPALARRTVDLFAAEAVEELAVAATRLRREARVEPVLAALDTIVSRLGDPVAWVIAVGWIRLQAAVAHDADASDAGDQGVTRAAAPLVEAGGQADPRQRAQAEAARLWTRLLAGEVDADAVLAAGDRLAAAELPWEGSRLVGQAAIRTTDASAARRLLERARELSSAEVTSAEGRQIGQGGLSEREIEVSRMVLDGSTYREIGARLFISPKTVEHHVARIRTKLGATTRAEFVAALRELLAGS